MSFNKLNTEGVMLFEQPFARVCPEHALHCGPLLMATKVPYENYRKVFRASQKNIEKELGAVQNIANDFTKKGSSEPDADAAVKAIDGMIARVEGLKRKVRSGSPHISLKNYDILSVR